MSCSVRGKGGSERERMICVTGGETRVPQLAARLEAHTCYQLQELRLDLLTRVDDEVFDLVARFGDRLAVTCRGVSEGGGFRGGEEQRCGLLLRAAHRGAAYVDVELRTPPELRHRIREELGRTRLVLSVHAHDPDADLREPLRTLAREPADVLKVAVAVDDAARLGALSEVLAGEQRPVLRIGMGPAGVLSRALYHRFGSPWTYVVADQAPAVAPGQLTVSEANAWRVQHQDLTPLGLLGGPQVTSSPGPAVYNRLLASRALPFCYLPVTTCRPVESLELLEHLGFGGLSVTMPAKAAIAKVVHELRGPARALGAVNTVLLRDSRRVGLNTDAPAVAQLLAPQRARSALVLGAGGAALAAAAALVELGCPLSVSARRRQAARRVAARFGGRVVPWECRDTDPFEVLVNATACGTVGDQDPMPGDIAWSGRTVLDAVLSPRPTALLRRARDGGADVFDGLAWWVHQGALQIEALCGQRIAPSELRQLADQWWRG